MIEPRGQRGFTLIEMMIVVAIIAILVGLLVPNFMRARAQAQTAACESNLKEIATALELYQTDHDAYPTSSGTNVDGTPSDPLSSYYKQAPIDPAAGAGQFYRYTVTDAGQGDATYTISCPGSHDPATLQNISPGTTNKHLQYSSNGGFASAAAQ